MMRARTFQYTGPPAPSEPPPQRARLLAFLHAERDAGRSFPTDVEIAQYMGWQSTGSVGHALTGLAMIDGQIKRWRDQKGRFHFALPS